MINKFLILVLALMFNLQSLVHAGEEQEVDLIVIAAPSILDIEDDPFFAEIIDDIIEFDIAYANAIYGNDEIILLVDGATRPYFEGRVPESILVEAQPQHIWMRDFTTVNPHQPIQFRYTAATFENDQLTADAIQNDFNTVLKRAGIEQRKAYFAGKQLLLDGGNIVDNYAGRVITTERFLKDNELTKQQGIDALKQLLGAEQVAIIPSDEPIMAHSDGMVMFSDANTLFVNRYEGSFRRQLISELKGAFPGINLVEIDAKWDEEETSACGINLNATVTSNYIYMPHFADDESDAAMVLISRYSDKTVIPIPAKGVCKLGGSVRCLSWQQSGVRGTAVLKKLKAAALSKTL